jgi:hypothetical protein
MAKPHTTPDVPVTKDPTMQRPIPTVWRPVFRGIVSAFAKGDFRLSVGVPGVSPVRENVAAQIAAYLKDYGETLVELPEETWETSVCMWTGARWDTIVDLWTIGEDRSDLILQTLVSEAGAGFKYDVRLVYVP